MRAPSAPSPSRLAASHASTGLACEGLSPAYIWYKPESGQAEPELSFDQQRGKTGGEHQAFTKTSMADLKNEKSKSNATFKPSNAANVGLNVPPVLRTLQAVVRMSPIQALAEAANLAVRITMTIQVLCPQIIDNEH